MMSETDKYPDLEQEMEMAEELEKSLNNEESVPVSDTVSPNDEIINDSESSLNGEDSIEDVETTIDASSDTSTSETESSQEEAPVADSATLAYIAQLQAEIVNLQSKLDAEVEQRKTIQGQYMRLTADFDNFRRRTAKEKEELEQVVKKKTIMELLSVVDNFERARTQIKPANEGEMNIHKSYQGVYKTFVESLKKIGVSAMHPEGKPFDPNYHEAMLREPTKEYQEGIVMEQLVRGYLLNNEVLRHAMVKVAAPFEDDDSSSEEANNPMSENNPEN